MRFLFKFSKNHKGGSLRFLFNSSLRFLQFILDSEGDSLRFLFNFSEVSLQFLVDSKGIPSDGFNFS